MKRFFKIFGIVSACVVGIFGVIIACVYIFGNNEDTIRAESINFTKTSITTYSPFSLRVVTPTENGQTEEITLSVDKEGIVDIPSRVSLGENFVVWPIKVNNTTDNVGGVVTITANSGTLYCKTQVFVDVKSTSITTSPIDIGDPEEIGGDVAYKVNQMDKINFNSTILPLNALNPSKNYDGSSLYKDKEIIYALYSSDGLLDPSIAEFVSGSTGLGNIYSTASYPGTVYINIKADNGKFYLKSYVYDTYSNQELINSYDLELAERLQYMIGYTTSVLDDTTKITFVIGDNVPSEIRSDVSQINGYVNNTYRAYFKKATGLSASETNLNLSFKSSNPNISDSQLDVLLSELTLSYDNSLLNASIVIDDNNIYNSYIEYTLKPHCLRNGITNIINPVINIEYFDLNLPITVITNIETFTPNVIVGNPYIVINNNDTIQSLYDDGRLVVNGNENASFKLESYIYSYTKDGEEIELLATDNIVNIGIVGEILITAKNVLVEEEDGVVKPVINGDGSYIYLGETFTFTLRVNNNTGE